MTEPQLNPDNQKEHNRTPPPPPLARKLLRYMLGFGVSFGLGLAPLLGTFNIPGVTPVLSLIPKSVQLTAIPLAAILMGIVAVVIQWYGGETVERKWLRRAFLATLGFTVVTFFALLIIHTLVVVRVDFSGGKDYEYFLVGFSRPIKPPCDENVSDSECIKRITFNPSAIESFWGDRQIRIAKLALISSYLLFMSSFGLIVGLLLLQEHNREVRARQRANRAEPKVPDNRNRTAPDVPNSQPEA